LPTDGNPMRATLASPLFNTSKPSPFSDFFDGSKSWDLYLASFAFRRPKWYSVAGSSNVKLVNAYVIYL
jgi:hypothetical protein